MTSQQPTQSLLKTAGTFLDRTQAESAQQALIAAGTLAERLSIEVQQLDPNPPLAKSKGIESAKAGAIAGGLFGSLISILLTFSAVSFPGNTPIAFGDSTGNVVVVSVLCLVAGAAAGGVIGLLSGSSVPASGEDRRLATQKYLLVVQTPAAELDRIRDLVRQHGGEIQI